MGPLTPCLGASRLAFIAAGLAALLSGCSDASKMEGVCRDIAKDSSVDPGSLKVNRVLNASSDAKSSEVTALIREMNSGKIPAIWQRRLDSLWRSDSQPQNLTVAIDFTANDRFGQERNAIVCTYLTGFFDRPVLKEVVLGDSTHHYKSLGALFTGMRRPDGLSSLYEIK